MFANVKLASRWTLSPGYTFLTMHLHRMQGSMDTTTGPETEGGSPNQQAQLRSNVNLPWHWQWTTSAYFVGRLPAPKSLLTPASTPIWHGNPRKKYPWAWWGRTY
jgi:hypothetical protein